MIVGIGIDIINVDRIGRIINKWNSRFTHRIFTYKERLYCEKKKNGFQSYAARFAAKEALLKALGLGLSGVSWNDIEVTNSSLGQPFIELKGNIKNIAVEKKIDKIFLTISHSNKYAIAQIILEGKLTKKSFRK